MMKFLFLFLVLCLPFSLKAESSQRLIPQKLVNCEDSKNDQKQVEVLYSSKQESDDAFVQLEFYFYKGICQNNKIKIVSKADRVSVLAWTDEFMFPWDDLPYDLVHSVESKSFHKLTIQFQPNEIFSEQKKRTFPIAIQRRRGSSLVSGRKFTTYWNLVVEQTSQSKVNYYLAQEGSTLD